MKKALLISILILVPSLVWIGYKNYRLTNFNNIVNPNSRNNGIKEGAEKINRNGGDKEPQYNISFNEGSFIKYRGGKSNDFVYTFNFALENKSVEPYIDSVGFNYCNVIDDKGNEHPKSSVGVGDEISFDKALLPGESTNIEFEEVFITIKTESNCSKDDPHEKFIECNYDESTGNCVCEEFGFEKIKSCNIAISNDGSQASNLWGILPKTVHIN